MATITIRGENRVRKVIQFDGGTGNGAVDEFVPIFPATGRVGLLRLYIWCTESLASAGAAVLEVTTAADAGNDSFFRADAEGAEDARNVVAGSGFLKCQGLSFDYELMRAAGGPFILDSDVGFYVSGFAISDGTLVIDATYESVTSDGALAGDDHSADFDDYIAAAVWAAAARTLTALDEDSTTLDLDATLRAALGLASANLDTQLGDLPTNAELATALAAADDAVLSAIAGLNDPDAAAVASAVWSAVTRTLTALDEDSTTLDIDAAVRGALGLASADLDTQLDALATSIADLPTNSELATALAAADDAVLLAIGDLNDPSASAIATAVWASATRTLSALGFTLGASDLAADTIGASELAESAVTEIVNAVLTTVMTESYAADGSVPTLAQAVQEILQVLTESIISGTTWTVKRRDGSTTAVTLTLNSATEPTSVTRSA